MGGPCPWVHDEVQFALEKSKVCVVASLLANGLREQARSHS